MINMRSIQQIYEKWLECIDIDKAKIFDKKHSATKDESRWSDNSLKFVMMRHICHNMSNKNDESWSWMISWFKLESSVISYHWSLIIT